MHLKNKKKFELANSVAVLYYNYALNYRKYHNYFEYHQDYQAIQNRVKRRTDMNFSAATEYELITEKLAEFNYQLQDLKLNMGKALIELNIKLGMDLTSNDLVLTEKKFDFKDIKFRQFINSHYQFKQLHAKIKILKSLEKQANAQLLPQLNLRVEYQKGSFSNVNSYAENRVFFELSSSFSFDMSSNITKTKLDSQSAKFELKALERQIKQDFESQYKSYLTLRKQIALTKNRVLQLIKIKQSKKRLLSAGKISWQIFLTSIDKLIAIKNKVADLEVKYLNIDNYLTLILAK